MLECLWKIAQVKTYKQTLIFNMQDKQLFLTATEDDITDVLLDAKNIQLKTKDLWHDN